MCNDFGNDIAYSDYLAAFSQTRIPVKWPDAAPNLEPRDDIWPTDRASVIRRIEDGTNEFSELRWGFPSARPKGPPVINFRSEGRRGSGANNQYEQAILATRCRFRLEALRSRLQVQVDLERRDVAV
jgi:putative SOS response-associated peptidase YedK